MKRDQIEEPEVALTPVAKRVVDFVLRIKISTAVKATGLSGTTFYNIKSGRNNASLDVIQALSKAFPNDPEASFSWLNDGVMPSESDQKPTSEQPINPGAASDSYNPLKEVYDKLIAEKDDRIEEKDKMIQFLQNELERVWERFSKVPSFSKAKFNSQAWMQLGQVKKEAKIISMTPSVSPLQVANM